VAMIEATIGTFLLLLGALGSIQIAIVLHGSLAAYSAGAQLARTYALTRSEAAVDAAFARLNYTTFSYLHWQRPFCTDDGKMARCQIKGQLPTLVPGVTFVGGNQVEATGAYPLPGQP
jgi:Tfp pilus assembly protein PilV